MGNRLSKIYTRTGDDGTTGLADGSRTEKDSLRMEAIGTVDELNSAIGMTLSHDTPNEITLCLTRVQHDLFDLGGELAIPSYVTIKTELTQALENQLDKLNNNLPYLKEFILPAGGKSTSCCHLARCICRRAERRCVSLNREETLNPAILTYLNRLSDLLFVISRVLARHEGGEEVLWKREKLQD
ncbi:MAG: cob(I)yrinic acid a,c-diamide adenosyltransferase [Gammaproteobacteria bacterium]|nr:cob(I)yrinic acid a,c-diamide adenosyltransferase [Gammaproteobacteria bacterium]